MEEDDFTLELEKDFEEILKTLKEECPFDDDLPDPGTPLYRIMQETAFITLSNVRFMRDIILPI